MTALHPPTPQIGPIIQRERKARRLSLEQLAALSGVSKSMLSQIERGAANPTFAVLWSLTRALKIDFSDLVGGGRAAPVEEPIVEIVSVFNTPEIKSPDGTCRLRILSPPRLAGMTEWYEVEIAPHGSLDSDPHAPGAFEHLTALTGGLVVTSQGVSQGLQPGETARYKADVPHAIENRSADIARALMVLHYG